MTPVDQLVAIAAAQRAGYTFDASEVVSSEADSTGTIWYTFAAEGYLYYVSEHGDVESNVPWQVKAG